MARRMGRPPRTPGTRGSDRCGGRSFGWRLCGPPGAPGSGGSGLAATLSPGRSPDKLGSSPGTARSGRTWPGPRRPGRPVSEPGWPGRPLHPQVRMAGGDPSEAGAGPARRVVASGGNGEDLARVAPPAGVEGVARLRHDVQVSLREDPGHEAVLLDADPMFAADRPARLDRGLQDLAAGLHNPLQDALLADVERS